MKKLILVAIPVMLAACGGGGSDAPATQAYDIHCTNTDVSANCTATPQTPNNTHAAFVGVGSTH